MKIRGYNNKSLSALTIAAALFCAPFSAAYGAYQDSDDDKKKPSEKIELVEEKAPRNARSNPKSVVEPKRFIPFDESPKAKQDGFFYLTEKDSKGLKIGVKPSTSNAVALDSILNNQSNKSFMTSGFGVFSAEGALDFTIADGDSQDPALDGFALSLKTAINLGMPELAISPESVGMENPLMERHYNLGVSLGYSGFNLDASLSEKEGGVTNIYTGIDIGFSYRTQKWMTRVGLSEYTYSRSPFSDVPETVKRLYSIEFGGAYNVSPWMSLTGGLKVTDYNRGYNIDDPAWSSQVYLGGRLSY